MDSRETTRYLDDLKTKKSLGISGIKIQLPSGQEVAFSGLTNYSTSSIKLELILKLITGTRGVVL